MNNVPFENYYRQHVGGDPRKQGPNVVYGGPRAYNMRAPRMFESFVPMNLSSSTLGFLIIALLLYIIFVYCRGKKSELDEMLGL